MSTTRVLNGRYELSDLLGRGGMADVYKGRDIRLGRTVAVKLLRADLARDPQFQARFRREAQAVAGLNHPAIVAVYDTGEYPVQDDVHGQSKVPYIVMECVTGRTLRDLIRSKDLTIAQSVDYLLGVLSALEYSHRSGIVHRDIKPANVMVTDDGNAVKVMDFGIARAIADSTATMTQTQAVLGTAQYLSPEQARGETVDSRSDLYSAGCLLYEMLTGRPPFMGDSPVSVAYQHVRETAEAPSFHNPAVTPALDSVLIRALQKNRADRFQDAAAFRRALTAAKAGIPVEPFSASEAPTDPDGVEQASPRPSKTTMSPTPAVLVQSTDGSDHEPATRAMARVLAGGPLTTGPTLNTDAEELLHLPAGRAPDRQARKRRGTWIATFCVFLALVLAGGGLVVWNLMTAEPAHVPRVAIPAVETMGETDALAALYNAGLKPSIERTFDDAVPKGQAVRTDPPGGSEVNPQSAVKLVISNGPSATTIPDTLVKSTEASARDALKNLGLVAGDTQLVNDGTIGQGMVVNTNPAVGQQAPAGSRVDLMVSTGKVTMPALYGLPQADAEAAVKAASPTLQVTFVPKENGVVEPGKVTNQSSEAGSSVDQYSTVTVEVAAVPAPVPEPEPTPEPTPTATACASAKAKNCTTPPPTPKK
ncbi:MAG: serine/threonine protein kinase [Micrococcaceae bacterium]|nr:serine/threonine protein kinase [Micrococcaceae bacterium]